MRKIIQLAYSFVLTMSVTISAHATLTLYTTSWSMYGSQPYEYDGAYKNGEPYGQLKYVANPDMVKQFNQADIVAWAFMQVWNSQDPEQARFQVPQKWDGLMHFDDLWGELPLEGSWISPLPAETQDFLDFCIANEGACSAIQVNGNNGQKERFNYADQKGVGQLNSFGAFINSDKYTAKRIIAIGGANTPENKGVSTATFDAIFANQDKFLAQFKSWMTHFKNLKGVDYDFEPPINLQTGGQLPVDERTLSDYKKLFKLAKATREKLGPDAYISLTITVNQEYLEAINQSVEGGWFKKVGAYVNSVNLMTYDLHGPWDKGADPYTANHAYVKQPNSVRRDEFAIRYGAQEVVAQVLGFGLPQKKLQVGIAAYGRGYSGVDAGDNPSLPGFEQPWQAASYFSEQYTTQGGLVPYNAIDRLVNELGYQDYALFDEVSNSKVNIGNYLYHFGDKQFVGYQSPDTVKSLCQFIQNKGLQGAIMWSADTDLPVSNSRSLVASFRTQCK